MRRWTLPTVALFMAATGALASTPAAPATDLPADGTRRQAPKVTLSATPTSIIQGQASTLSVRTRRATKGQKVVLQRRAGGSWLTVDSDKLPQAKKLDFWVTPPVGTTSYRVKLKKKGATPGATSKAVSVLVQAPTQSVDFALPTSALEGTTVTAAATFTPARAGRTVELQSSSAGTWTTMTTTPQNAAGSASFTFDAATAGVFQYRVVAVATGELAAWTSDVRTLTVTEPDPPTSETTLVSHDYNGGPANSSAGYPSISDDGRYVAYHSNASDLVPDDPDNDLTDIFLWDRATDTNVWVSRSSSGGSLDREAEVPTVSGNGRYVFYSSSATNITGNANPNHLGAIYRWDRVTGETVQVASLGGGYGEAGMHLLDVTDSGSSVLLLSAGHDLTDDDYSTADNDQHLFKWTAPGGDVTEPFELIDKTATGKPGDSMVFDGSMSDDGLAIAFTSWSANLDVDPDTPVSLGPRHVYVWRSFDVPRLSAVSVDEDTPASGDAYASGISGDGTVVAFSYSNTDLGVPTEGHAQAMTWTTSDVTTPFRLVSHKVGLTTPGSSSSLDLTLSTAGLVGVFRSFAPLDNADTNGYYDLYSWHDGVVARIAQAHDGAQPNASHGRSDMSRDGEWVAFDSFATNLTPVSSAGQIYVAGVS